MFASMAWSGWAVVRSGPRGRPQVLARRERADDGVLPAPGRTTAVFGGCAPCAPIQTPRTKWIFIVKTVRNAKGA
jgi:hypothetical protein